MPPNDFNNISRDPHGGSSSLTSSDSCSYNIDIDIGQSDLDSVAPSPQLNFSRLAYNLPKFNEQFEAIDHKPNSTSSKVFKAVKPSCTRKSLKRSCKSLLPITDWLVNYNWKKDFLADFVAGITIAVFQVPQSMGYSLLAKVPPVLGLYSSFFPALIYSIMGSSKHAAVGTFAVVSLMTGSLIAQVMNENGQTIDGSKHTEMYQLNETNINLTETTIDLPTNSTSPIYSPTQIAIVITFLIGIYQILFGLLRLGFVSVYMSEQLISSFITASSLYVFTSQMGYLFGLHLTYRCGPLSLFYTYIEIFEKISHANWVTFCMSGSCIIVLLLFKLFINDKIKQWTKCNIPFPIELVVVISGTVISNALDLSGKHVDTVGKIPTGLPQPAPPNWSLISCLWARCIPLSVVAFAITYSTGRTFAAKHKYEIESNQELLAIGATNTFGCFFSCLPSAASLSRSAVQESAGGRTQMVSLVNCAGILAVILYLGALLEELPNCVLAAIIVVALKSLFLQIMQVKRYCQVNKLDGSIWIVTFLAVILLDVDRGLYVGLAYSLLTLIYKSQRPKSYMLGSIDNTDVYVPVKNYQLSHELTGIKIYQFCGPLHFANIVHFKDNLAKKTGVCVNDVRSRRRKLAKFQNSLRNESVKSPTCGKFSRMKSWYSGREAGIKNSLNDMEDLPSHIIIDCSMFSYIDTAGVNTLKTTVQEYESIGVKTFLANCAAHVVQMLEKDIFYEEVPPHHVYITIHDAVHHAMDDQRAANQMKTVMENEEEDEMIDEDDEENHNVIIKRNNQENGKKSENEGGNGNDSPEKKN